MSDPVDRTQSFVQRYERGVRGYNIFFNPEDFPGKYVVRGWTAHMDHTVHDREAEVVDSLELAREKVPKGLVYLARYPTDVPSLVEAWVPP